MAKNSVLSPNIEYKTLSFKVETVDDDQGIITGYLSTFNNIDLGNGYIRDRVLPGAYKRTIAHALERKTTKGKKYLWPHLWMHTVEQPIGGYIDAKEDSKGLLVTYQLDISKNASGIPNNPTATMVFSGYKHGYIDEQSIGYEVIKSELVKEMVDGEESVVRNLIEIRLWEGSSITSNFAMDPEALVTGIKGSWAFGNRELKSVCGNTSGPIGPRDESWDGSAAEKWIWGEALDDDDNVKPAVAKKYFLRLDGDPKLKGSYSYPFWTQGHISVGGVKACAGALSGARGASSNPDSDGMKKKIETLYNRINKKYPDDTPLTPPWDDGKSQRRRMNTKDFNDHYREEVIQDWMKTDFYNLVCALQASVMDIFTIGDEPQSDVVTTILEDADDSKGFISALKDYVQKGIDLDVSNYISEEMNGYVPYNPLRYMSDQREREHKAMTASDATTGGFTSDHVDKLRNAATKAMKKVQDTADSMHDAADTVSSLVDGKKAGRMFSSANTQALSDHADDLHEKADALTKGVSRQMKAVTTVADDLASILQGSEAAYGTDPGDAGDRTEGKATSHESVRRPQEKHSSQDTTATKPRSSQDTALEQEDLTTALEAIRQLRKPSTIVA